MSNNAEQYTVKTPAIVKFLLGESDYDGKYYGVRENGNAPYWWRTPLRNVVEELIKENERLRGTIGVECVKQLLEARQENKLYREALIEIVNAQTNANTIEETTVAFDFLQSSLNDIVIKISTKER